MIERVTIGASDLEATQRFYGTVLPVLGYEFVDNGPARVGCGGFAVAQAGPDRPVTTRLHIGFVAPGREAVDAFWRAGIDAGYVDDGAPGPRPRYLDDYYGAFLLDPDGNSVEAVVHGRLRRGGSIDHLWFRVTDRIVSCAFYETLAPHAGFDRVAHETDRTRFSHGPGAGSFTLVDGEPTTPFHLAFGVPDGGPVDSIHIDPDGHTVELVDGRGPEGA